MAFIVTGSIIGAIGSNSAADTQAAAQDRASQTQLQMFNTINQQEQPFMQSGYAATARLNDLLGLSDPNGPKAATAPTSYNLGGMFGGNYIPGMTGQTGGGTGTPNMFPNTADHGSLTRSFTGADYLANQDPGYQFQLQTGAQALRNQDTPGVGALSGPALKDLMAFNQNMAATGYQGAFNRFTTQQNNIFSRLSGMAGLGQNAASNTGTAGTALGTGAASTQAAAGGSRAAGIQGVADSLAGGATLAYLFGKNNNANSDLSPVATTAWKYGTGA
jgi:hypothetical protein